METITRCENCPGPDEVELEISKNKIDISFIKGGAIVASIFILSFLSASFALTMVVKGDFKDAIASSEINSKARQKAHELLVEKNFERRDVELLDLKLIAEFNNDSVIRLLESVKFLAKEKELP